MTPIALQPRFAPVVQRAPAEAPPVAAPAPAGLPRFLGEGEPESAPADAGVADAGPAGAGGGLPGGVLSASTNLNFIFTMTAMRDDAGQ